MLNNDIFFLYNKTNTKIFFEDPKLIILCFSLKKYHMRALSRCVHTPSSSTVAFSTASSGASPKPGFSVAHANWVWVHKEVSFFSQCFSD